MTELAIAGACPRCGTALPVAGACSRSCGARGACALICCPGCGLAFPNPQRSRLAWHLSRWLARRARRRAAAREAGGREGTLAALPSGGAARIVGLRPGSAERQRQLAALGLVPGADVRLRQRHPALVLEVGETTLALDVALARDIRIETPEADRTGTAGEAIP